jgi:hypothetical protein
MPTPPTSTPWVPVWALTDPPAQLPTPVSGKWLKGGTGGAMSWEDLPVTPGIVTPDNAWKVLGTDVAFSNGWINYPDPYGPGRFRKNASGLVVMEGLIYQGTVNTIAFVLPVGYRPLPQVGGGARDLIFQCAVGGGVNYEAARCNSAGEFRPTGANTSTWISLDGIKFYTG